jgi:hypothetical protein
MKTDDDEASPVESRCPTPTSFQVIEVGKRPWPKGSSRPEDVVSQREDKKIRNVRPVAKENAQRLIEEMSEAARLKPRHKSRDRGADQPSQAEFV